MKTVKSRMLAVVAAPVAALSAIPAQAQTTTPTFNQDFLTPFVTALTSGLGAGMGILMLFAPSVIFFAIVWMLLRKSGQVAKTGGA